MTFLLQSRSRRLGLVLIAGLVVALLWVSGAAGQALDYQRPVEVAPQEKDIGAGYVTPQVPKPRPRDYRLQVLDTVLLAALGLSVWIV